jgi:periplasmic protein TonB
MLIALGVLLVALVAVVLKDWDFWFPSSDEEYSTGVRKSAAIPATPSEKTPPPVAREHKAAKPAQKSAEITTTETPAAAKAERTTLPDMQLEVIAGNRRTTVPAKNNAIHIDVAQGGTAPTKPQTPAPVNQGVVNAITRAQVVAQAPTVTRSVMPDYPRLARQMKVEGTVILQAMISKDGNIQELQVVSGPGILAGAAREAVKQWHFKPYLVDGQAVETQARITVNFTISTS